MNLETTVLVVIAGVVVCMIILIQKCQRRYTHQDDEMELVIE